MGGSSYDRDVYSSSSGWGSYGGGGSYSAAANNVMHASTLDDTMNPLNRTIKSTSKHPIVIMLDVTGSNTGFAKIVYDKMPMFFGQIEQKGYLDDFEISVCAVGDAYSDYYPLQIAEFKKGTAIDDWLKKLVLEGRGGGQRCETYELAAYYLLHNFEFERDAKPIVFFLGDEAPYSTVNTSIIKEYVDTYYDGENVDSKYVFEELLKKIPNTYMFLNPYNGISNDDNIKETWLSMFGKHSKNVIMMQPDNEKAIVDLMLGVLSLIKDGDLKSYKVDMLDRGQTNERIESVDRMLLGLSNALVPTATINNLQKSEGTNRSRNKNSRL